MIVCATLSPVSSQDSGSDSEQHSPLNSMLYFWGNDDLTDCLQHFDEDGTSGSSNGYGEIISEGDGERIEVDVMCRMKEKFTEDMFLNPLGKIKIEFGIRLDHAGCDENTACKNLNITIMKNNIEIARKEFEGISTDENVQIEWELDIGDNMSVWNKSGEEPMIRFEMSKPGWIAYGTPCDLALRCGGSFRLYYSDNNDGMNSNIQFPIVDAPEIEIEEVVEENKTPGFGILASLFALALAFPCTRMRDL
mgnify:FL=1